MKFIFSVNFVNKKEASHFKKNESIEFHAELHPVQNLLLLSINKNYSDSKIKKIVLAAREKVINDYTKEIADNDLPFDVLLRSPDQILRFTLSSINEESADLLDTDSNMYSIKLDPHLATATTNHKISALSQEQGTYSENVARLAVLLFGLDQAKLIKALQEENLDNKVLNETNYPHFIHAWKDKFSSEDELKEFLQSLIDAPSILLAAYDHDLNMIGALAISSTHDSKLHYLSFFVVAKAYRGHTLSADLLRHAINNLSEEAKNNCAFTFYTDQPFMLHMMRKVGIDPDLARLKQSIQENCIPTIHSFDSVLSQQTPPTFN